VKLVDERPVLGSYVKKRNPRHAVERV
jgi:hypothetical protein